MNIRWSGAALGLALVLAAPAFADDVEKTAPAEAKSHDAWVADFDKAVAQAKAEKKDLLVDFTGSDWCGWCIRLHKEVFDHDEFLSAVKKEYVLVALDFPKAEEIKAKVPNPARNAELQKQYGIQGFPSILLMTAEGEVFGRTGYQPGGAAKYVEHIAKLRADGLPALKSAKDILAELEGAADEQKAAVRAKAITALEALEPGSATGPMLAVPVKAAFDADADNKSGVRAKAAKALLKSGTADESVIEATTALDPKNELGLLEYAVMAKCANPRSPDAAKAAFAEIEALFAAGGPKDAAVKKQLAISGMSFGGHPKVMNDKALAKKYAAIVKEIGYGDDERLKAYVEKLLADETK